MHLAEIDSLGLLSVFDGLLVPETVYAEIEAGGVPPGLADVSYELVETDAEEKKTGDLDVGESAAISIARERKVTLLTDDLAARESAADAGIEVHGSIGVIALAHGRGRLDADEAATQMRALQRETSLFTTDAVIERGIELLDETR
ncbi:nucleic acid-binding protein [Halorubrum salipaludis]|uniref:Nucleic acid-binding protein n=1 Tax=Halorubrum salipaludis TaxID=2032630 RepID=A0A2A2FHK6_9EURY|nr:nucleic acid-binding protein [Halorubrum salipaludis]